MNVTVCMYTVKQHQVHRVRGRRNDDIKSEVSTILRIVQALYITSDYSGGCSKEALFSCAARHVQAQEIPHIALLCQVADYHAHLDLCTPLDLG